MSTNMFKKTSNRFQYLKEEPKHEEIKKKEVIEEPPIKANNVFKKLKEKPKEIEKIVIDNNFPSLNVDTLESNTNLNFLEKAKIAKKLFVEKEEIKEETVIIVERDARFLSYLDDICDLYNLQKRRSKIMLTEEEYKNLYEYENIYDFEDEGENDDEISDDEEIEYDEFGEIYE